MLRSNAAFCQKPTWLRAGDAPRYCESAFFIHCCHTPVWSDQDSDTAHSLVLSLMAVLCARRGILGSYASLKWLEE